WDQMFAQNTFRAMFQLKQAEIEKSHGFRMLVDNFDQQFDYSGKGGAWIFIAFQPTAEFTAHANAAQPRFRGGPEKVSFPGKMAEHGYLANARQARDFVGTAS